MMQNLTRLQVFKSVKWIQYNIMWIGSRGIYPLFFIALNHENTKPNMFMDSFIMSSKKFFTV